MLSLYEPFLDTNITPENATDEDFKIQTIQGKKFESLLDLCFSYADVFSLTKAVWANNTSTVLEQQLAPFLIRRFQTRDWFCSKIEDGPPFIVTLYHATKEAKTIIRDTFNDIFLTPTDNCTGAEEPTLEDLCFFADKVLFLGSLTHEYICDVYPLDDQFEEQLCTLGKWIDFSNGSEHLIRLPNIEDRSLKV